MKFCTNAGSQKCLIVEHPCLLMSHGVIMSASNDRVVGYLLLLSK